MSRPSKIVCAGRTYREHAKELGNAVSTVPLIFLKPPSTVIASGDAIVLPRDAGRVDFEGEIGVVIGTTLRKASAAEAARAVRGIVAVNDVSARDWQKADAQWWRAKGSDTFCPIGEERRGAVDLNALTVVTRVNGEECQRGQASEMVFPIAELLSYISQSMTLEPGDVVATGTPAGVKPLQPGDEVEVEVVGWSRVRNPVVAEA
ncbi:MAG: fumarylacetoacetate hydrolase family protein [Gemmatimonadaceae bacterium]|nr:fumarylacetoacetate hydrolase family protein [Gemmatimonadaceae bacterium]MCW5827388.1 fumarylacetoacetate hydrolase family protein [Gemmatimonadaceae bacterium]